MCRSIPSTRLPPCQHCHVHPPSLSLAFISQLSVGSPSFAVLSLAVQICIIRTALAATSDILDERLWIALHECMDEMVETIEEWSAWLKDLGREKCWENLEGEEKEEQEEEEEDEEEQDWQEEDVEEDDYVILERRSRWEDEVLSREREAERVWHELRRLMDGVHDGRDELTNLEQRKGNGECVRSTPAVGSDCRPRTSLQQHSMNEEHIELRPSPSTTLRTSTSHQPHHADRTTTPLSNSKSRADTFAKTSLNSLEDGLDGSERWIRELGESLSTLKENITVLFRAIHFLITIARDHAGAENIAHAGEQSNIGESGDDESSQGSQDESRKARQYSADKSRAKGEALQDLQHNIKRLKAVASRISNLTPSSPYKHVESVQISEPSCVVLAEEEAETSTRDAGALFGSTDSDPRDLDTSEEFFGSVSETTRVDDGVGSERSSSLEARYDLSRTTLIGSEMEWKPLDSIQFSSTPYRATELHSPHNRPTTTSQASSFIQPHHTDDPNHPYILALPPKFSFRTTSPFAPRITFHAPSVLHYFPGGATATQIAHLNELIHTQGHPDDDAQIMHLGPESIVGVREALEELEIQCDVGKGDVYIVSKSQIVVGEEEDQDDLQDGIRMYAEAPDYLRNPYAPLSLPPDRSAASSRPPRPQDNTPAYASPLSGLFAPFPSPPTISLNTQSWITRAHILKLQNDDLRHRVVQYEENEASLLEDLRWNIERLGELEYRIQGMADRKDRVDDRTGTIRNQAQNEEVDPGMRAPLHAGEVLIPHTKSPWRAPNDQHGHVPGSPHPIVHQYINSFANSPVDAYANPNPNPYTNTCAHFYENPYANPYTRLHTNPCPNRRHDLNENLSTKRLTSNQSTNTSPSSANLISHFSSPLNSSIPSPAAIPSPTSTPTDLYCTFTSYSHLRGGAGSPEELEVFPRLNRSVTASESAILDSRANSPASTILGEDASELSMPPILSLPSMGTLTTMSLLAHALHQDAADEESIILVTVPTPSTTPPVTISDTTQNKSKTKAGKKTIMSMSTQTFPLRT